MFKQLGISTLELLLSLTVTSSAAFFTLEMADEAEKKVKEYQQTVDVKQALKRIHGIKQAPLTTDSTD